MNEHNFKKNKRVKKIRKWEDNITKNLIFYFYFFWLRGNKWERMGAPYKGGRGCAVMERPKRLLFNH